MKKFQKSRSINKKKNTFQSSSVSDNIKYSSNLIGPTLSTTSKSIISQNYIKFSSLSPKPLNKKGKNYLYDTKKTFSLNLEIIKNYISQTTTINTLLNKDKEILTLINNVQNSYKKKFDIIKKIKDMKSKILIELQIYFDKKRKCDENIESYKDKIKENEEGVNNKEEYVKLLQQKLKEVEIYIHRITIDMKNLKSKKKYQKFTINEFLEDFDFNHKNKEKIKKDIDKLKQDIKIEKNNIKEYKEQNRNKYNNNEILIKNNNDNENDKIQKYILKYKNNIKKIYLKINLLKNNYNFLNKRYKLLQINKINSKKKDDMNLKKIISVESNEDDDKEKEKEKSQLGLDLTRKLNNYMDFSSILNNQTEESQINITKNENNYGQITTTNNWDISEINKKDI